MSLWKITLGDVTVGEYQEWIWAEEAPELFGFDGLRVDDASLPGRWGEMTVGPDLPGARTLQFRIQSDTPDEAAALVALDRLSRAWTVSDEDQDFTITTPRAVYFVKGRVRRKSVDLTDLPHGIVYVALEVHCPDPRFYGETALAGARLSAAVGGLSFPAAFPIGFGSIAFGEATLENTGNAPTGLAMIVVPDAGGSIDSPVFEVLESGERLSFPGLSILEGTFLGIDLEARTVRLTASLDPDADYLDVSNFIDRTGSDWWTRTGNLPPGVSTIRFSGSGGAGSVLYLYRPASLI